MSTLTLLIVFHQIGKGFEIDAFVDDFQGHSQRRYHPKHRVHRDVFTGLKIHDGLAVALRPIRQLRLAVAFGAT